MKTKIKHIANIQTGFFAKQKSKGNEVYYYQLQDFDDSGRYNDFLFPDLNKNKIAEQHFLKEGDVLFAAKSAKNFATVVEGGFLPAVASTSFFVIRLINNKILPEFLAFYLNTPSILNRLKNLARGTSIPSIRKKDLEDIEIVIPSVDVQEKIVKLQELSDRETTIRMNILEKRKKIIKQKTNNIIKSISDDKNNAKRY